LGNGSEFLKISAAYKCNFDKCNSENCTGLNNSIAASLRKKINDLNSEYQSVTFLIHGFRKPFKEENGDTDSPYDFSLMRNAIDKYYGEKTLYVEIYWDAYYDCCFSARASNNERLFELFGHAQSNAEFVGKSLNAVITGLNYSKINIVTHSLGAKVALNALFDTETTGVKTPSNQKVNICLIAPAISPESIYTNYYKRNSDIDFKNKDNYNLVVVYNEKDFVLRKKDNKVGLFGPGPYKYGNTTLGCNHHDAATNLVVKIKKDYPNSNIKSFDVSYVGKCHLVSCYCYSDNLEDPIKYISSW
jgi:hypothetical protein